MKIVLDLETIPLPRPTWLSLTGQAEAESIDEVASQNEAYEKAQFQGAFLRIVCLGALVIPSKGDPKALAWYGNDEPSILSRFWSTVQLEGAPPNPPIQYITHNGFGFDFPVLWQRSIVNQVKPTKFPSLSRFRSDAIFDTLEVWSNWDTRHRIKLDTLANVLHVPRKSGHGSEVAQRWLEGAHRDVAEYCLQDLVVTYSCYCKMSYQPVPSPESLLAHTHLIECAKPPAIPIL